MLSPMRQGDACLRGSIIFSIHGISRHTSATLNPGGWGVHVGRKGSNISSIYCLAWVTFGIRPMPGNGYLLGPWCFARWFCDARRRLALALVSTSEIIEFWTTGGRGEGKRGRGKFLKFGCSPLPSSHVAEFDAHTVRCLRNPV